MERLVAEVVRSVPHDRRATEAHEPTDRAQRQPLGRGGRLAEEPIGVEVAVVVPAGPVGARMARQRGAVQGEAPIEPQVQPEVHPEDASPIGEEREVEGAAVPGGEHAGGQGGEAIVDGAEQVGLVADEQLVEGPARQGHGPDRGHGRVEPVGRQIGLDVEPVDVCLVPHPSSRTTALPLCWRKW